MIDPTQESTQGSADPSGPTEGGSGASKGAARNSGVSPGRLIRLATKELREILRDRRTIVTLVLMPLLVYPLLGVIFTKFVPFGPVDNKVRVLVGSEQDREDLLAVLDRAEEFLASEAYAAREVELDLSQLTQSPAAEPTGEAEQEGLTTEGQAAEAEEDAAGEASEAEQLEKLKQALMPGELEIEILVLESGTEPRTAETIREEITGQVLEQQFDVGVVIDRFPEGRAETAFGRIRFMEFIVNDANPAGDSGRAHLLRRLTILQNVFLEATLQKAGRRFPFRACGFRTIRFKQNQDEDSAAPPSLLTFFPLMLVLMTMTGAVYPAIDLTAGERERGTMEILVAAPVSRMSLLFGKFVAVLAVAMLTAVFNMIAMLVTTYAIGFDQFVFGEAGLTAVVLLQILGLLFVFACFFSAVLLSLTSFARSFKEAQAYLIPMMLVALAPGVVSLLPGVELTYSLAVVPLLNMVLLGRDLLAGQAQLALAVVAICSTTIYGLLAMSFAARIFGTDAILTGGSGNWASIWQRPQGEKGEPALSHGMLALALLFPLFIVISGVSGRLQFGFRTKLVLNAMILLLLFVIVPLALTAFQRLDYRKTFQAWGFGLVSAIAAVLLGLASWTMIYELEVLLLSNERMEALRQVFEQIDFSFAEVPLWLKLICLALAPAVCEEVFFRGYLLSSLRKSTRLVYAILFSAVLFGVFHVVVPGAVMYERMVPSTLLGILLAVVCIRTGSLFPGMIMHGIHNGLLLTIAHYEEQIDQLSAGIGFDMEGKQHLPWQVLTGAAVLLVLGLGVLACCRPRSSSLSRGMGPGSKPGVGER